MNTFTGLEYIKIALANAFGKDKLTWQERINFIDNNPGLDISEAEDIYAATAAMNAIQEALDQVPTGYIMGLDATASGLQIMGILSGCESTCEATNVINNAAGERKDAYVEVAKVMGVTRSVMKQPVMTHYYGSKAVPKRVFGEDELVRFYSVLGEVFAGPETVLGWCTNFWDSSKKQYSWTLPDGFVAEFNVMVRKNYMLTSKEFGNEIPIRRYENEAKNKGISLAANIVHSIDAWVVREMIRRAKFQGFELATIHDSFWCSPNHMNKVRVNYKMILAELYELKYMQYLIFNFTGDMVNIYNTEGFSNKIRGSEYALS